MDFLAFVRPICQRESCILGKDERIVYGARGVATGVWRRWGKSQLPGAIPPLTDDRCSPDSVHNNKAGLVGLGAYMWRLDRKGLHFEHERARLARPREPFDVRRHLDLEPDGAEVLVNGDAPAVHPHEGVWITCRGAFGVPVDGMWDVGAF